MLNVSFFSYKGGSGRTSLLFNTLPFLAEELGASNEEPIVVLDLDVDSKGLSYLIDRDSGVNSIQVLRGDSAIAHRNQAARIDDHPFFKTLVPIGEVLGLGREQNRTVLFVSANATREDTRSLNGDNNYDGANVSLDTLQRLCEKYHCKAIVCDTPAGDQLAGTVALNISKKIVTVMRITNQFRRGTYQFLREKDFSTREGNKTFILVPNAVPDSEGTVYDMTRIMDGIRLDATASVRYNKLNLNLLQGDCHGINEVRQFKFEERNLNYESKNRVELSDDERLALERYKILAKEIANEN